MFHKYIMCNKRIFTELNFHRYPIFNEISLVVRPYRIKPCSFDESLLLLSRKRIYFT